MIDKIQKDLDMRDAFAPHMQDLDINERFNTTPPTIDDLLLESGDKLLTENGDFIIL